jgi:hypothetical protein
MEKQKDINIVMYQFTEDLYNLINNSGLPVSVASLIVKDVYRELESTKVNVLSKLFSQEEPEEHTIEIPLNQENKEEE